MLVLDTGALPSGERAEAHIMPASVNKSNAQHYKAAGTVTEFSEFPGRSHWTCGEPGWEQVADRALEWALTQAR